MRNRKTIMKFAAVFAVVLSGGFSGGFSGPSGAAAEEPLRLLYQDRPPYYVTSPNGTVGGLVSGVVAQALSDAGMTFQWLIRPGKRQIETIRQNRAPVCSPGWFKKPERQAFAKFSAMVYQDRPQVVIIRSTDLHDINYPTLAALFADRRYTFGAKLAYSYGAAVDRLITETKPAIQRTPQDVQGMVRMLIGRRFDYMLAAQEEFKSLQADLPTVSDSISALQMQDIPAGNKRYLMCSKKVSDDILRRFNKALADLAE